MAIKRIWKPSPNYSSRGGSGVRLIVLHTSEGATSNANLANFLCSPSSGVSYHVSADNVAGQVYEYVKRGSKSWSACNANPYSVHGCFCTPTGASSGWSRQYWLDHMTPAIKNMAAWVAEEASALGLPVVALTSAQAQGGGRGVCQHKNLGSGGCGHLDCGGGFPMDVLISYAKGTAPAAKPPPATAPPASTAAPPFPHPAGHYIGTPRSDAACHSGCYSAADAGHTRAWQQRMAARGWTISADGCYGAQSEQVCRGFQADKGLAVDGLVGPSTWAKAWTAPVT